MKKKLSILIYSLSSGGAERVVSVLLHELHEKYEITLFLMNKTIFYNIPKTLKIIYLENSSPFESGLKKLLKLPILAFRYKKFNDADISLSFMNRPNYIAIIAKLLGMKSKCIISERAMPSLQHKNGIQGFINRILIGFLYKKANKIIGNSIGNSMDLQVNFNIKNVLTIPNPINLNNVTKLSKEYVDYRNEKFTFITIGRLDYGKNHKVMISAMKNIDAKLYIIGDGELKDSLKNQIKKSNLQDKVILLGRQINPYKYLKQADCFLFTSLNEGFPNVLLEALACNLPIISTDCKSGPREILAPESNIEFQLKDNIELSEFGILIPINDLLYLQKAMNLMIKDKKLRTTYKNKSNLRIDDFKTEQIIKQYEEIINA